MGIFFLFSFTLSLFFSQIFVRPPQTTILPFHISFSQGWFWSLSPVQCHEPLSIVLQAFCLSDIIPLIYLLLLLYNHKGFDSGWFRLYMNGLVVFPTFFNLSVIFAIRSSWSEPQSTPGLVFSHCIELLAASLAAKNIINLISVLTIWWCPCVESCVVGRGCVLWPVHSLVKTLLAFALLHFVLQGQTVTPGISWLPTFHSSPLWWKWLSVCVCVNSRMSCRSL